MADKKKTTNKSQMVAPPTRSDGKAKKTAAQSETAASTTRAGEKEQSKTAKVEEKEQSKVVKAVASQRNERKVQESKTVRRDNKSSSSSKSPSAMQVRLRNNRYIRFILDAYYELRHKVTWPSFNEARNMTIAVILLSLAVGIILGAADEGLYQLFLLISHIGGIK